MRKTTRVPALSCLGMLFLALGGCREEGGGQGTPRAPGALAGPSDSVLPEGAEGRSLLGRPLYPPVLAEDVLRQEEATLKDARARVGREPDDPTALVFLGRQLAHLGRYQEAVGVLGRGAALYPNDPRFPRYRGQSLTTLRRLDEAVADLRHAAELMESHPDEPEPAVPEEVEGVPLGTLRFGVWYHLGLAHYLDGELEQAALALNEALGVARDEDTQVAATFWLVSVYRRLGLESRAARALESVHPSAEAGESLPYRRLLLLYRGEQTPEELLGGQDPQTEAPSALVGYGVGLWHYTEGRRERGFQIWEQTVATTRWWPLLGYLAAEAELAHGREG